MDSDLVGGLPEDDGQRDIFVHDRDVDMDGVFDEPLEVSTTKISRSHDGGVLDASSFAPQTSRDGRFVAFVSAASNVVLGDDNGAYDAFVYDIANAEAVRVSVTSEGAQVPEGVEMPGTAQQQIVGISGDGRFVAFPSTSASLMAGASPGAPLLFVHDRDADGDGTYDETAPGGRRTALASLDVDGLPATAPCAHPALDADGSELVFKTFADLIPELANNTIDVFVVIGPPAGLPAPQPDEQR